VAREASRLAGGKLKADLALRRSLRSHEYLDGFDAVLNRGVVGFQTAIQLVYFGRKLAVLASISRIRTKARTTKTLISMACLEFSTVVAMIAPCSVNA
jgi:hypothetical protein